MRTILVISFLSLLLIWGTGAKQVLAQPIPIEFDEDIAPFKDKQDDMLKLILEQSFALKRLVERVDINERAQVQITNFLKFPKNVKYYRDSCLKVVEMIRKRNDELLRELQVMHYGWFPHQNDVLAIYTRYGELKMIDRVNDDLTNFLSKHRDHMTGMLAEATRIENIYKECDFLLSAKLH